MNPHFQQQFINFQQGQMEDQKKRIDLLNQFVKTLENQLEAYKKQIETFTKYYYIFEEYDNMAEEVQSSRKEKQRLKQRIRQLEQELNRLRKCNGEAVTEKHNFQREVFEKQNWVEIDKINRIKIKELEERIQQLQNYEEVEQVKIEDLSPKFKVSVSQIERQHDIKLLDIHKKIKQKEEQISEHRNAFQELKQKYTKIEKTNIDLVNALIRKENQLDSKDKQINEHKEEIQKLTLKLSKTNQQVLKKSLFFEEDKLKKSQALEMEMQVRSLQMIKKQKEKEIRKLNQELQRSNSELKELQAKLTILSEQFRTKENSLLAKVKKLEEELILHNQRKTNDKVVMNFQIPESTVDEKKLSSMKQIIQTQLRYISEQKMKIEELSDLQKSQQKMVEVLQETNSTLKKEIIASLKECQVLRSEMVEIREKNRSFQFSSRSHLKGKSFSINKLQKYGSHKYLDPQKPSYARRQDESNESYSLNVNILQELDDQRCNLTIKSSSDLKEP